ncbi:MAG: V-type ATPase 116kDa subunit family protein [Candidatus Micrarchaeota archaeon]
MLTLEKMQKVRVIAPRDDVAKVVHSLYGFGAIQVQECKTAPLDLALPDFQAVSEMLIRLRAEEKCLGLKGAVDVGESSVEGAKGRFDELKLEGLDLKRRELAELESQVQLLEERRKTLAPFKKLPVNPKKFDSERVNLQYFQLKTTQRQLRGGLGKTPYELLVVEDGKRNFALIAYDRRNAEKIQGIIAKNASVILDIPAIEGTYADEISKIGERIIKTKAEIEIARQWLADYKNANGIEILKLKKQLEVSSIKSELPFKFGRTDSFSVVEGWIESKNMKEFESDMGGLESVLVETIKTNEVPPSKLNNPKLVAPFEFLVEFFSLPKSYELDPTLFIAITYPLFFGAIMGDIGYGLLCLFAALLIKLKMKDELPRRIAGMLALSAFSAIIFGIIYAEFFGLEHIFGSEMVPLIHRVYEVEEMINLAILVGVLHLALGLIIGTTTNFLHKHYNHAIAKLAWLLLEISMIATIVGLMDISLIHIFSPLKHIFPMPYCLGGILLSFILIAMLESPTHLLEVPSLLANMLSYLRIVALGLSGVIIAQIINKLPVDFDGFFAMITFSKAFDVGAMLAFIAFAFLLVFSHIMALLLAIIEAGIQSLRLHYVEFFSKFFEGGGLPFVPLRKRPEK